MQLRNLFPTLVVALTLTIPLFCGIRPATGDDRLSASLNEVPRRIVSLSYDGEILDTDQLVDLGFQTPGEPQSFEFTLKNPRARAIALPTDFVQVEGPELQIVSTLPAELGPGQEVPVVVRATGAGDGTFVRELVLRKGRRALMKVRLQVIQLSPAHAESRVRELYDRFQRFAEAAKRPMSIELDSFRTLYSRELEAEKYLGLFDWLHLERIEMSVVSSGRSDRETVSMEPFWRSHDSEAIESEQDAELALSDLTVGELVELSQHTELPMPAIRAATTFRVSVKLEDRQVTYRAAVFWSQDGARFSSADRVLIDLQRVWNEKRIPSDSASIRAGGAKHQTTVRELGARILLLRAVHSAMNGRAKIPS